MSANRASMSRSFWKVMESMERSGGVHVNVHVLVLVHGRFRCRQLSLCGGFALLAVLARITLDAARGVHQPLLAREERVAVRADFQAQLLPLGGAGGPGGAARAMDVHVDVIGVDSGFHDLPRKPRILVNFAA